MVTVRDIGVREYCGDCERHRVRRALVTVRDIGVREYCGDCERHRG